MEILDLIFTAFGITLDGEDVLVVFFSENLGAIRVRIPLSALADYFGAVANAWKEISDETIERMD